VNHSAKAFAVFNLLLVAGCSSPGGLFPAVGNDPFKVDSDPVGAAVFVMGENIGVTPVMISHKDVFPNTYPREKEALYGRVTLKKEGCVDFTRTISTEISNNGLRAHLDCATTDSAASGTAGDGRHGVETVEQRLARIKDLLGKGLITEEEAGRARARILNEL
jgi:PEGA domain